MMTTEDKKILLKDLCARLPYGVIVDNPNPAGGAWDEVISIDTSAKTVTLLYDGRVFSVDNIKPYLRPMSSMTDEELMEFGRLKYQDDEIWEIVEMWVVKHDFLNIKCRNKHDEASTWIFQISRTEPLRSWKGIDWLLAHHFDYRGLIKKGLALEAPEGMYKTE